MKGNKSGWSYSEWSYSERRKERKVGLAVSTVSSSTVNSGSSCDYIWSIKTERDSNTGMDHPTIINCMFTS